MQKMEEKKQISSYLVPTQLSYNHRTTDTKLGCVNLSITYPQAIWRNTPITQSFKVSNWSPSVWICYCQFWFKNEDNILSSTLLPTLQGICGVNRVGAQPLVQRPPTELARRRVIILILLQQLITMLEVSFFAFNHRPFCLMWEQLSRGSFTFTKLNEIVFCAFGTT